MAETQLLGAMAGAGPDGGSGVYFLLDFISKATHGDWTTLSVSIDDLLFFF